MRQKKNSPENSKNPFESLFRNKALLRAALTHPSFQREKTPASPFNFERLEFLGDSVLGLVVTHKLFQEKPKAQEGELSYGRSLWVSKKELARQALALRLDRYLLISGQREANISPKILADALEALIGALFLDRGLKPAKDFIEKMFKKGKGATPKETGIENPKGVLQEIVQRRWKTLPEYKTTAYKKGKGFHSSVSTPSGKAVGIAKSKKESEAAAAAKMIPRLQRFLEKTSD